MFYSFYLLWKRFEISKPVAAAVDPDGEIPNLQYNETSNISIFVTSFSSPSSALFILQMLRFTVPVWRNTIRKSWAFRGVRIRCNKWCLDPAEVDLWGRQPMSLGVPQGFIFGPILLILDEKKMLIFVLICDVLMGAEVRGGPGSWQFLDLLPVFDQCWVSYTGE